MRKLDISADELVRSLLLRSAKEHVSLLDSCGSARGGSNLLIAGVDPVELTQVNELAVALRLLDGIHRSEQAAIFTLSYDLGRKLQGVPTRHESVAEPMLFLSTFDGLLVHDYAARQTLQIGKRFPEPIPANHESPKPITPGVIRSETTRKGYIDAVKAVKERIRSGDTYQTNLTRKNRALLASDVTPRHIFARLRDRNPAPYSAFITRNDSTVISASPESFFRIEGGRIIASPIKGTRPRGADAASDIALRDELLSSNKDRAENTMIVDLLRNDLGRVCEFGSVRVDSLCEIEQYPSLFHMVSTVSGLLRPGTPLSVILTALFPCGSITGAPKISTMHIIDELETSARGLSMGAIGYYIPSSFGIGEKLELSVAIRTMVLRGREVEFSVGGGIVTDSQPAAEWDETVVKSTALLDALGATPYDLEQFTVPGV